MHAAFTEPPRFWRQLAAASALLALLFAVLQPPSTAHLGFVTAALAWLLHISIGMLCAVAATRALLRSLSPLRRRPWLAVLCAGLLGGLLFAPIALALEVMFPPAPAGPPDDWLDQWESAGGLRALLAEYLSLLPSYLAAWVLVNALPMLRVAHPQIAGTWGEGDNGRARGGSQPHVQTTPDAGPALQSASPCHETGYAVECRAQQDTTAEADSKPAEEGLLQRLPLAVGRQLVSITADLHYLHVTTRRGRATLLGSLGEAELELGERGLRIHRSHWVALEAVRRLRRTANGWRCELIDGRSLPVSRRRAGEAKQRLGTDFVIEG